jgi:predicted DCC family thiol-disulfide oxidoreductase YuxK
MAEQKACLYYDGSCPLCSAEMTHLQKQQSGQLDLLDIHSTPMPDGKKAEDLLAVLHYRSADGRWLTGLDANVAAWSHTRLGPLWRILRWPLIRPLADYLYALWARRRYARRYARSRYARRYPSGSGEGDRRD